MVEAVEAVLKWEEGLVPNCLGTMGPPLELVELKGLAFLATFLL
jgi:hypothetical protein